MAYPVTARTYNITSTRSTYVSLLTVMGDGMHKLKVELLAAGWVMWASSDGTTGPTNDSDRTDRIATRANFATRATIAAAAQSWFMVKSTLDVYVLVTYQGATDDVARVSFSVGGYTLAATKTHQPTATYERVICSDTSLILATTSADRIFHIWCDTAGTSFRLATARSGVFVGLNFGVETFTPAVYGPGVTCDPAAWGFATVPSAMAVTMSGPYIYVVNQRGGLASPTVASVVQASTCIVQGEGGSASGLVQATLGSNIAQLQGDYIITSLSLWSTLAGALGKLGNMIDWWATGQSSSGGDTLNADLFICMNSGSVAPLIWPWNGTTPVMA